MPATITLPQTGWRGNSWESLILDLPKPFASPRSKAHSRGGLRLARCYPPAQLPLPTVFGNMRPAAEYPAGARYGFDTVTAWLHLYRILGETVASVCDDRRLQPNVVARFHPTFAVGAAVSAALL